MNSQEKLAKQLSQFSIASAYLKKEQNSYLLVINEMKESLSLRDWMSLELVASITLDSPLDIVAIEQVSIDDSYIVLKGSDYNE